MHRQLRTLGLLAIGWAMAGCGPGPSQSEVPMIVDGADLMMPDQREAVARYHEYLLDAYDVDYRVVTLRDVEDLDRTAVEIFRALGASSRSEQGRALLLLIDATADKVRFEVGYPLEGSLPDAFVSNVEGRQMVPFFEASRVADGIVATTELIVARIAEDAVTLGASLQPWVAESGGGGAVADARLGAGPRFVERSSHGSRLNPGSTPEATVAAYLSAMAAHNAAPHLAIYTTETQRMLAHWTVTPAQMDNVVRSYRRCGMSETKVSYDDRRAVIRYSPMERTCAPFFLEGSARGWQLDLTMMQKALRFDTANAWRLVPHVAHPYGFAFDDWRFDSRGYPRVGQ